jgi:hypothetical protein
MTRPEAIALVEKWDGIAARRGDVARRSALWRILYALDGWYPAAKVIDDLDALTQTDEVEAIRELLGLDTQDAPAWAGRI